MPESSRTPAHPRRQFMAKPLLADDGDGFEGLFEDDAGYVWSRVRRLGAVYWWKLDTQYTQRHPAEGTLRWLVCGVKSLASLGPLGAPADSAAG